MYMVCALCDISSWCTCSLFILFSDTQVPVDIKSLVEIFPGIPKEVFQRMIMDEVLPVESVVEMMVDRKIRGPSTLPQ